MYGIVKFIAVFIALFVADVIWTLYIRWSAKGLAFKAASAGSALWLCSAFVFIEVVKDYMVIVPALAGSFLGTYVTIKWDKS